MSISAAPPAFSSKQPALVAVARKALADVPGLPIEDIVAAGTLGESLEVLARTMPDIILPQRWAGLLAALPARMRRAADEKARAMGMEGLEDMVGRPLMVLNMIEDATVEGPSIND
jgi:hypothetical protein